MKIKKGYWHWFLFLNGIYFHGLWLDPNPSLATSLIPCWRCIQVVGRQEANLQLQLALIQNSFLGINWLFQFPNPPLYILTMVSNSIVVASSLYSSSPCTLFDSQKLSSPRTFSRQSKEFLLSSHRNLPHQFRLSLSSKRGLPSVCFFSAGDKSDPNKVLAFFPHPLSSFLFPTPLSSWELFDALEVCMSVEQNKKAYNFLCNSW